LFYRRDQTSLVNAVQEVVHHSFVLREINIDMHDLRHLVLRRGHMAHAPQDIPAMLSLVVWTRGVFARFDSFMS
jgi:hypothetical protein